MENKRYLKLFANESEYNSQKDEVMAMPHVVLLEDTKKMVYEPLPPKNEIDYSKEYFTIEALEDGIFEIKVSQLMTEPTSFKYRLNNEEWVETMENVSVSLVTTDKLQISCINDVFSNGWSSLFKFTKSFNVYGNIMSLLYGDDFVGKAYLKEYLTFGYLFFNTNVVSANNLILPPTTLTNECYVGMFEGCTRITTAPELLATTLAENCYQSMFNGCTSLTEAPELLATTLAYNCYYGMFAGCISLNYIKMLAIDVESDDFLTEWVNNVGNTGTFVKKKGVHMPIGDSGIPKGWTVEEVA